MLNPENGIVHHSYNAYPSQTLVQSKGSANLATHHFRDLAIGIWCVHAPRTHPGPSSPTLLIHLHIEQWLASGPRRRLEDVACHLPHIHSTGSTGYSTMAICYTRSCLSFQPFGQALGLQYIKVIAIVAALARPLWNMEYFLRHNFRSWLGPSTIVC